MPDLSAVNIRGNPLNTIPSVFHNDWDKVKKYLLTLTDRKAEWRERKVCFLVFYVFVAHYVVYSFYLLDKKVLVKQHYFGVLRRRKDTEE